MDEPVRQRHRNIEFNRHKLRDDDENNRTQQLFKKERG